MEIPATSGSEYLESMFILPDNQAASAVAEPLSGVSAFSQETLQHISQMDLHDAGFRADRDAVRPPCGLEGGTACQSTRHKGGTGK